MYPPHHKQVICVKNLPEYNDQIIHHLFGNFGKITTYRFVNTPDHYRKDAIVEFEHPQAPFDACNIHNGRVIGNNKLYVEILPMDQPNVPNHRPIELNNPRPPFENRIDNPMGGSDFRKVDQFRNYENNGHFHGQRNEIFHMQGRSNNELNNFSQGINHEMPQRPEINRGPELGNNIHPPKFHPGPPPPINNPMHFQHNMNFRPAVNQQVPNIPIHNEYRPPPNAVPNMSPGRVPPNNVHHYPNNVIMSPQQQNMNPHNMYPVRPQQDNGNSHIEQSPRAEDTNISAALAKYPELKSQIGNPEFMKTIIDICRKEASALIENKLSNQQDIRSSNNHQHSNRRDHSRSRSRSRSGSGSWSRSRSRHHHHSSNKNQFNNVDSRRTEYNNHHRSRSRSYSRSRSHSRSCSPVPGTYHSRQFPQVYQQGNRSPIRKNHNQYYHNKYNSDQKRKHYEQRRSSRSHSRSNQRERYRHHSRSRSRERDPKYLDKQRQANWTTEMKPFRNQNKNKEIRMEIYKERKTLVIGGDGQGQSLNPHFKKNKTMENRENGNDLLHPIVCEDQDLSQSTAGDSVLLDQSNLQESHKHQAGVQHKDQPQKASKPQSNIEIELKYPEFDNIISKMEAYRENEKQSSFYNQKRMDIMASKKPMVEKKFVYSSRMEENKESNYPFDPDYDWPLATVLGVYPDDMGSLDFMKNLEGNIRNLLEIPQACPLDIGTFSKNMCDTLLRSENIVSNQTTGELLDESDVLEPGEVVNRVDDMVNRRYNEGVLQDDLYEVQMDEGGREKTITPVKGSYAMRNNSVRFRNRFFGSRNMNNSFRGRNRPFEH